MRKTKPVPTRRVFFTCIGAFLCAGGISALMGLPFRESVGVLPRPDAVPAAWVFAAVWAVLYVMMGTSISLTFATPSPNRRSALIFGVFQTFMSILWCPIFFLFHAYGVAFVWLIVLWVAVFVWTVLSFTVRETAGVLLIPCVLWLTYLGWLNVQVLRMGS